MKIHRTWQIYAAPVMTAVFLMLVGGAPLAQAPDPFAGTWTLNVATSTYSPGPPPKSGSVTFTITGPSTKAVIDGIAATDAKTHWEYTATADGKDHPVTGNPDADTIVLKRINARSVETTNKKGGKVTLVNVRTVSADGKTLTVTTKGTNAAGQAVNHVQVFDKK